MTTLPRSHTFSPLDPVVPPLYNALIYAFPCLNSSRETIHAILQQGLSLAVADEPLLAAVVIRDDQNHHSRPGSMRLVHRGAEDVKIPRIDLDKERDWPA